jgi:hypothetical protein
VKIAVEAFEIEIALESRNVTFFDVDANAWYAGYVAKAVSAGLVNGYSDGVFGVGRNITREEMAVIIWRYAENFELSGGNAPDFNDNAEISEYAKESVLNLRALGILNGGNGNNFNPKNNATRAECAHIIRNLLKLPFS